MKLNEIRDNPGSTKARIRLAARSQVSSDSTYSAGSRGRMRASSTCVRITDNGVRSSCDASAVNRAWRANEASSRSSI